MRELTLAEMAYNSHPCTCAFETRDGEVHTSSNLYSAKYAAKLRHFSGDCKSGSFEIHVMGGVIEYAIACIRGEYVRMHLYKIDSRYGGSTRVKADLATYIRDLYRDELDQLYSWH